MLTLYATDKNHDIVLVYKYTAEANAFMNYLPIAEKILDSIKILYYKDFIKQPKYYPIKLTEDILIIIS